jgi:hypothetical protein
MKFGTEIQDSRSSVWLGTVGTKIWEKMGKCKKSSLVSKTFLGGIDSKKIVVQSFLC